MENMHIAFSPPDITEEEIAEVVDTLRSGWITTGPKTKLFEKKLAEYMETNRVVCLNSATACLEMILRLLGIGPGDEVITTAYTYTASASVVEHVGAKLILVDVAKDSYEMDYEKLADAITEKTKAIIGVHLYGQPFEFNKVKEIADRHHLYVVEDCAQGHDALYEGKMVGTLGDLGCFSFYPGKNLYAFGEGGSVTGYRKEYFDTIEMMKNQGCTVRYYHDMIGYNYRLEGIQGAVLSVSLKYLPEWTARRREIGWRYTKEITNPAITLQHHPENTNPVFHMFEVEVKDDPERFLAYMAEKGIECNRHYPVPCHLQNAYKHLGYQVGDCPNAEYLASHCATLPLFPEMTDEEVEMVIRACNAYQTA